jgi:hypothetical protein
MAKESKGLKLRRQAKDRPYYKVQFGRTDGNAKRKLGRHIRRFPEDVQAQKIYSLKNYGDPKGHVANMVGRARARA